MVINQNKTFNSIIFRELLFKMQKIAKPREGVLEKDKSEIEIIYEKMDMFVSCDVIIARTSK